MKKYVDNDKEIEIIGSVSQEINGNTLAFNEIRIFLKVEFV